MWLHARTLNTNAGRRRGSKRRSHGEVANAYEEHSAERAKETFWSDEFQGVLVPLQCISQGDIDASMSDELSISSDRHTER